MVNFNKTSSSVGGQVTLKFMGLCNCFFIKYYIHLNINLIMKKKNQKTTQNEMGHFLFKSYFQGIVFNNILRGLNHESSSVKSPLSTDYIVFHAKAKATNIMVIL